VCSWGNDSATEMPAEKNGLSVGVDMKGQKEAAYWKINKGGFFNTQVC